MEEEIIENQQNQNQVEEEEEDDWNPTPYKMTILNKVNVKYTDQTIKSMENKLLKKQQKELDEELEQNINSEENFKIPQSKKQKQEKFNQKQDKEQEEEEEEFSAIKDDFFDNEEDQDNDNEDAQDNLQEKNPPEFYDPMKDEKYESWVNKSIKKQEGSQIVLSCPQCFQQLCYDCQAHEKFDHQYRAHFVKNVKINMNAVVHPQEGEEKKKKQKKEKQLVFLANNENINEKLKNGFYLDDVKQIQDQQQNIEKQQAIVNDDEGTNNKLKNESLKQQNSQKNNISNTNKDQLFSDKQLNDQFYIERGRKTFEIFFQTLCACCSAEVGVFEADSKLYIFHNVIPSLG